MSLASQLGLPTKEEVIRLLNTQPVADQDESYKKAQRDWARTTRAERKAAGLCSTCGKDAPIKGRATCERCRMIQYKYREKLHGGRRSAGQCRCGRHLDKEGAAKCKACRTREADKRRRRIANRLKQGVCTNCGREKKFKWRHTCEKCLETKTRYRKGLTS